MNWLDRAIGAVAPGAGLRRARQRQAMGILARAYDGARIGRRTEGWVAAGTGANAEIAPAIARLRDRCRDLVRNSPYAAKAVGALVSNMVGTGLLPWARAAEPEVSGLQGANQLPMVVEGVSVYLPPAHEDAPPVEDPTPCVGKVGMSLDGKIRIVKRHIGGPLRDRWLMLFPDENPGYLGDGVTPLPPEPGQTFITNKALKVRLGFDWGAASDHWAGIQLNRRGEIDKFYFGTVQDLGAYDRGVI